MFRYILLQRRFGWKTFIKKTIRAGYIRLVYWFKGKDLSPEEFQYQIWLMEHESTRMQARAGQVRSGWIIQPKFSFLLIPKEGSSQFIEKTVQSILSQTYPQWELLVITSHSSTVVESDRLAQRDNRIKLVFIPLEGDINLDLRQTEGDFFLFIRCGDTISPHLLHEVTAMLQSDPQADILYFDEDKYDPLSGYRFLPWFKPSLWSPDLLVSVNYLRHAVIRKTVLESAGIPYHLTEFQEWEMMLRITEQTRHMVHIPKVLFHQAQPQRAAVDPEGIQWMSKVIESYLARRGLEDSKVTLQNDAIVRIRYPTKHALASIVIPNKNHLSYIKPCISSILEKTRYPNFEILLVDNQSDEAEVRAYYQSLSTERRIKLLSYPYPFNFHSLNNWAVGQSEGEVVVFLNNDTEVLEPDWLEEMVGCAVRPEVGVVGAKLLRPNGKIQHAGMVIGLMGHAGDIFEDCEDHIDTYFGCVDWYRNYHAVTGACMAIRREVFTRLGGFDEVYEVGYGDIDLCLRAHQKGYLVVYTPHAVLKHHEGGTRKFWLPRSDILRATLKMWSVVEAGDGYFNPNLSYHSRVPSFINLNEESRQERLLRILQEFSLVEGGAPLQPPQISMPYET